MFSRAIDNSIRRRTYRLAPTPWSALRGFGDAGASGELARSRTSIPARAKRSPGAARRRVNVSDEDSDARSGKGRLWNGDLWGVRGDAADRRAESVFVLR